MFVLKKRKTVNRALAAIILLYFAVALVVILSNGQSMYFGSFESYDNDDVKYIRSGAVLAKKGILTYENPEKSTVFIMPGLSFVLAAFFKLFGEQAGITAFRIFQVLLQGASLYLLFLITGKAFNQKTALAAAALDALYMPELFSVNLILMECIFKFLLLLLCYEGIKAVEQKNPKDYAAAGAIWAAACYFRPTVALLPIVVLLLWMKYKYTAAEIIKYGMLTALVFIIFMSPWWLRNYNLFHEFIPFTLSDGNPFLQGTYINYDQSRDYTSYKASTDYIARNQQEKEIGLERLKKFGVKYPIKYIYWYTIGKTVYFWGSPFYWRELLGIKLIFVQIYHHALLFAALIGLFRWRQQNLAADLMLYLIIYLNIIYLPFYTFSRYSYPIMGFIIAFASNSIIMTQRLRKEMRFQYEGKNYTRCR